MATIQDAIKAYHLHRATGMLIELNNLFKEHGHAQTINQTLAKHLFEGGHQEQLPYRPSIHYSKTFIAMSKALCASSLMIDSYKIFEELYNVVYSLLKPISGIAELTIYDVAHRIGFIRKEQILPKDKVYLFRGARLGADCLRKVVPELFGTIPDELLDKHGDLREGIYDISLFDSTLQEMGSLFLEDFFCVYHRELKRLPALPYNAFQKAPFYYDRCIHI